MTTWLILALAAPFLWSISYVTDSSTRRYFIKNDWTMTWFSSAIHAVAVIPFFFFIEIEVESWLFAVGMVAVGLLWTLPFFLYFKSLEFEETSRVALFMQTLPIFALVLSSVVLGEFLSSVQYAAFVLLLVGGGLTAIRRIEGIFRFSKAFWLILLANFLWAVSDVMFKYFESTFNSFYSAFTFFFLGSALPAFFMLGSKKVRKSIRRYVFKLPLRGWLLFVGGQLFSITGSLLFAYALIIGSVALTTVLIGIEPLLVIAISLFLRLFFYEIPKEDLSPRVLVFKGVSLLFIFAGLVILLS